MDNKYRRLQNAAAPPAAASCMSSIPSKVQKWDSWTFAIPTAAAALATQGQEPGFYPTLGLVWQGKVVWVGVGCGGVGGGFMTHCLFTHAVVHECSSFSLNFAAFIRPVHGLGPGVWMGRRDAHSCLTLDIGASKPPSESLCLVFPFAYLLRFNRPLCRMGPWVSANSSV